MREPQPDPSMTSHQLLNYAEDVSKLYEELKEENVRLAQANSELERSFFDTVLMGFDLISIYDRWLGGHCKRVASYSVIIAEALELDDGQKANIQLAALLHDVQLIGCDRDTLARIRKGEDVSEESLKFYRQHSFISIRPFHSGEKFAEIALIISGHHEHVDGSGFPKGLKGDEIPLGSRIIAIADAYDYYRHAGDLCMSPGRAAYKLNVCRGTKLDADILLAARDHLVQADPFLQVVEIGFDRLVAGAVLADAIETIEGIRLLGAHTSITKGHIERLRRFARDKSLKLPIRVFSQRRKGSGDGGV